MVGSERGVVMTAQLARENTVMKRSLIALAAIMAASPALAGPVCERPISIGYEDWPPFEIPAEGGEPTGINPDIHRALAEITGCEIKWIKAPWKRVLRKVESGDLDIANTASVTEERSQYANFSTSYLDYEAILFLHSDDTASYGSLRDFMDAGESLGIALGYSYGNEADSLLAEEAYKGQVQELKSPALTTKLLAAGRIDGTIGNRYTLGYTARENGVRDDLRATNTVVQTDPVHFMFSKESVSQTVIDGFNKAIEQLKADGTIDKIVAKYTGGAGS
jgi:polar amino acid transport system substrate-binding protein